MEKMKKILALLLAALMLISMSACVTANVPGNEGGQKEEAEPEKEEPINVTMVFPELGNTPADIKLVEEEMSKYATEKYNVKVTLQPLGFGEAMSQIPLILSGNEDIGLVICFNPISIYSTCVAKEQIQDITDLLEEYAPDVLTTIGETFLSACRVNGRLYGVPTLHDFATGLNIVMRSDLLEKYNLDVSNVKTMKDLEPIFEVIRDNEPAIAPYFTSGQMGFSHSYIMAAGDGFGDDYGYLPECGTGDLTVVNYYESDEYKEYCNMIYDWNQRGFLLEDSDSIQDTATTLMRADKIFSYMSSSKPGQLQQDERITGMKLTEVEIYPASTKTHLVSGIQWVVPTGCKHPEKSVQLLNLLYNDADFLNLFNYGIEGKHYVVKEDGQIAIPEGLTSETNPFYWSIQFESGNEFITDVWEDDDADLWEQTREYNNTAICSKAMGFSFDNAKVTAELSALSNVTAQYTAGLECGVLDPNEYIPKLIDDMKSAGIDTVIAEKQSQLDAWLAEQNK